MKAWLSCSELVVYILTFGMLLLMCPNHVGGSILEWSIIVRSPDTIKKHCIDIDQVYFCDIYTFCPHLSHYI